MRSIVHIFNTALARLGGGQLPLNVSSLEDDTLGRLCAALFPQILDNALSAHAWSFALTRARLAPLSPSCEYSEEEPEGAPAFLKNPRYEYVYALPSDMVKAVRLEGDAEYVIESAGICAGGGEACLVYVKREEDVSKYPASFIDALAWALAGELAAARLNDTNKQQFCYQNYRQTLAEAIARDSGGQNPPAYKTQWERF